MFFLNDFIRELKKFFADALLGVPYPMMTRVLLLHSSE